MLEKRENFMKKFLMSFYYAGHGILSAFKSEFNMKIHVLMTVLVIISGFLFDVSLIEWVALIICIMVVISAEVFNTSIETAINLLSPDKNELAGRAKDLAAGAVLVTAIGAGIVGIIIFLPKFIALF